MASVRVAVRVRPMNKRERDLSSNCIIHMDGNRTSITNLKAPDGRWGDFSRERTKTFTYDFSYDSTDCKSADFVSQEKVFKDLGSDVLVAAFHGYNACVFAYGQTGSGKSFTMMGDLDNRGLIPRICEGLFGRIAGMALWDEVSFCTEVSYLEIYNERVRDLLRRKSSKACNLRVREHPKGGPYVEELSKHLVRNYREMEELLEAGDANRTTASTSMNDVSSRSHAIFTITFTQAKFGAKLPCEIVSKIHLVDLAGSERAGSTGASGMRLKEGGNINKSLVTLGNVISALAHLSQDRMSASWKKGHVFVPYRDSVLTWLLKDSLGGNSKTIMIATISPADVNYSETLSTLRYASRAKSIINKPKINEDSNVKLIRELRAEIAHLRELLVHGNQITLLDSPITLSMEEKLHENEVRVLELTTEWTNKWNETQNILKEETLALRKEGIGVVLDSELPHLIGIDNDFLSTGIILYHLKEGRTSVGCEDAKMEQDIVLHGLDLETEHCVFENLSGTVTLVPLGGARCSVNGVPVVEPFCLSQGAVILLGRTNVFRFNHPKEAAKLREKRKSGLLSYFILPLTTSNTENFSMLYNPGLEFERRQREELDKLELKRRYLERMEGKFKAELGRIQMEMEALCKISQQVQLRSCREEALKHCSLEIESSLQYLQAQKDSFDELLEVELKRLAQEKWEHLQLANLKMEIFRELKRLKVYWMEGEKTALAETWKMFLKSEPQLKEHEDHKNVQCIEMDSQVMPVEKLVALQNGLWQQKEDFDSCLFSKSRANNLLLCAHDEALMRENKDVVQQMSQPQTHSSHLVDLGHHSSAVLDMQQEIELLALGPPDKMEILNPLGSRLGFRLLDLQRGSMTEILEQMRMLATACHTQGLAWMQESLKFGWKVLEQDRERLTAYIEEQVQRQLQRLNRTNPDNDSELSMPSESPMNEQSACDTAPLKLTHTNAGSPCRTDRINVNCEAAAVLDGEKRSQEEEGMCSLNEPYSPEESANHMDEGRLSLEGETLTTVKTEKNQDVSPHKSSKLEMLAVSPAEQKGQWEDWAQGEDRPADHSVQSEPVSRLGCGSRPCLRNTAPSKEASDLLTHNMDGDISHLELGKTLLEPTPVSLPASLQADCRAINQAEVQEHAEFSIQSLPDCPLLEITPSLSGDTNTSEVPTEILMGEGQEAVLEDEKVCQDLEDNHGKSLGYRLVGKLFWLYKGASSHLQNTERAIRQIIERNYQRRGSWYKQIRMIVKDLPVYQRFHLKVTVKSDLRKTAQLSKSLRNYLNSDEQCVIPAPSITWSPSSTVTIGQDLQVFCQKLVDFPLCLQQLQSLSLQDVLTCFQNLIPDTDCISKVLLGIYWLCVANSLQPIPQPGCVLLFESMIYAVNFDHDPARDKDSLTVFHQLPLQQIKEIHVGFAGQHVRLQGSTEDSILTIYTYSKQLTQKLCQALLKALSWTEDEADHGSHPLLQEDLAQLSLDWRSHTPDCFLDRGVRLSSQFKRVLADLVYLLHGNMSVKPPLADMQLLLYTTVKAEVNHFPRPDAFSQLLLMETHLGLVQQDGVFHPAPRSITMVSKRAHFEGITLRRLSDIRCVLVGDKDSTIRVDIVFKTVCTSQAESKDQDKNSTAALPSLSAYNLFPQSEIWKLTFGCTTDAAFLINHLSTV